MPPLLAINAGLFEKLEAHRWPTIAVVDGPRSAAAVALAGKITRQSWRVLELTKLALRSHRPATTFDMAAQALLLAARTSTTA